MYKVLIVSMSLFLIIPCVNGQQEKHSIKGFFKTAEKDNFVEIQEERVEFLSNSSTNMPIIDDIEIRIRNTAFQLDKQRYTLRIEPRGIGESRASSNLFHANLHYYKSKKEFIINKLLVNRYMLILDIINRKSMLHLYKEMLVLYEDKINVLRNSINSLNFDLNQLLEAEDNYTQLKFKNIERERGILRLAKQINACLNDNTFKEFDTTGFITISHIKNIISNTDFLLDTNNIHLKYDRAELALAEKRYNLETAESRRYISFLEFSYDREEMIEERAKRENDKKDYNLNRAYRINLGIRIPFINVDRHDINRRKMTVFAARDNYEELKKDLQERINKDIQDIKLLVLQYEFLEARKNDVNAESSLKRYLEMEGIDPIVLLSIKEDLLKNDIDKEKIKHDIFRNYIRIINATGMISKRPLRNYLHKNKELISQ